MRKTDFGGKKKTLIWYEKMKACSSPEKMAVLITCLYYAALKRSEDLDRVKINAEQDMKHEAELKKILYSDEEELFSAKDDLYMALITGQEVNYPDDPLEDFVPEFTNPVFTDTPFGEEQGDIRISTDPEDFIQNPERPVNPGDDLNT